MIINSQLGGTQPTGTINITTNGTHDVSSYANADVQVPTTAPTYYIERTLDNQGKLTTKTSNIIDFTGISDLDAYILSYAYYNNSTVSGTLNITSTLKISGRYACDSAFYNCPGLTNLNLSGLTVISGEWACNYMFAWDTNITSIDVSNLTTISGQQSCAYMFYACSGLTSITFTNLTTITGNLACNYMFSRCTNLTSISFPALTSTSFGIRTNIFSNMLSQITGCTLHFPSNLSSVVSGLDGYPNFGGTNTVLAFDLPATA